MEPGIGPHRREAAEDLVAADRPAAVDALGGGRRQQQRHVVARLAVDRREHGAFGRLLQDEPAGLVAHLQQVGGQSGPVDVHVHGQRGGRRDVCQPARQLGVAVQPESGAAVLGGQRTRQVAGLAQLGEVFVEEPVVAVVLGCPLVEAGQHLLGQQGVERRRRLHRIALCHRVSFPRSAQSGANGSGVFDVDDDPRPPVVRPSRRFPSSARGVPAPPPAPLQATWRAVHVNGTPAGPRRHVETRAGSAMRSERWVCRCATPSCGRTGVGSATSGPTCRRRASAGGGVTQRRRRAVTTSRRHAGTELEHQVVEPPRVVDLAADRRAGGRFVAVRLAGAFCADAVFVDLGGLAYLTTAETLSRRAADCRSTSSRAARSPARARSAAVATLRARFLRNPASRRSCSNFFMPIEFPP